MKHDTNHRKLSDLMTLTVFALFALCLLAVLLTGAQVYRQTVQTGQQQFEGRTAAQYLTTRVRQADSRESIALESFGSTDALVFREQIGGKTYKTLVYCWQGSLRELFCAEGSRFYPEDGQQLLPLQQLTVQLEEGGLYAQLTLPDGTKQQLVLQLRSGKEVLP